jgi:hypothetical protein
MWEQALVSRTTIKLGFEGIGFSQYYSPMFNYDGYGGFDWQDMGLMPQSYIDAQGWANTGYANVLHGHAEVFTYGVNNSLGFGEFQSIDPDESFSLKSGTFASAWETSQPVVFQSWSYNTSTRWTIKATDTIPLSQTATTIHFANYGTDFKHIAALDIISYPGSPGIQGYTGYEIAFDNLKVTWDGAVPGHPPHRHAPHIGQTPFGFGPHGATGHTGAIHHLVNGHAGSLQGAWHSELTSLGGGHGPPAGLTDLFALPHLVDHFGT